MKLITNNFDTLIQKTEHVQQCSAKPFEWLYIVRIWFMPYMKNPLYERYTLMKKTETGAWSSRTIDWCNEKYAPENIRKLILDQMISIENMHTFPDKVFQNQSTLSAIFLRSKRHKRRNHMTLCYLTHPRYMEMTSY